MTKKFSSIEETVDAIASGKVVIVVDSEDRENEGDFLAAAETITAEMIHLMISEGRGQLCVPVMPDVAERLQLAPMVDTMDPTVPRFTVPVDHNACDTGISPLERTHTIRAMVDPHTTAGEFIRPGHIFPLIARPGGVLERLGHTESTVDMTRMAGLAPAGVLCEICSRDGRNMARRDELLELAQRLDMHIATIDALVEYRQSESTEETAILEMVSEVQQIAADQLGKATTPRKEEVVSAEPTPVR